MTFADKALAERLERSEGHSCAMYAAARARLQPGCGSQWRFIGGAYAVFDGVDSPITQCFGLGVLGPLDAATLAEVEGFFFDQGAHCDVEVSPLAGVEPLRLLCERGYRPIEISSVMRRPVERPTAVERPGVQVRIAGLEDAALWAETSAQGWAADVPELLPFLAESGMVFANREQSVAFLAECDGRPAAAAALCLHEGVALFAGASTLPAFRRRGLQAALLEARLSYAEAYGCDLAQMVAEAGSGSQRNAERQGFQIAYTRLKWRREVSGPR